ncbi:alpha/beta fold hydrolase [Microbacterium sp. cf332]|uniref:alpha/beta fold hydrolase n=1 Tax=Microbacterium sp. cf332 TaxID=1761804 RepID=UPI0008803824|nr:alpha/beta hydrolase [Microbacterium sp. cf332]SDQ23468.1 Pimeloyl-ACP methyl ester carboxylesterase [Microbacterium sp. cf332]
MMPAQHTTIERDGVVLAVTDAGGAGPAVLLLHGLAGSSRELMPTAAALTDRFHVLLLDQRGHGLSTRRPRDLSREAFVDDVVAVLDRYAPGEPVSLVGQSMGAHTAFLVASRRPDLVERLVMLEGHVAGSDRADDARELGAFFASWPTPFPDESSARSFLGDSVLTEAWIADLEATPVGLRPRFDADVMATTIAAVHEPRWDEWAALTVPTTAVFAAQGMFSAEQMDELIARRPGTARRDLPGGSHDAHLDAFEDWIEVLRTALDGRPRAGGG